VGDGFVAGKFERAGEGFHRVDGLGFHWSVNFSMGAFGVAVAAPPHSKGPVLEDSFLGEPRTKFG
jgi:hypothetical protein